MAKRKLSQQLIIKYLQEDGRRRTVAQMARDLDCWTRDQRKQLDNMLRHMAHKGTILRERGPDSAYQHWLPRKIEPARIPWLRPSGMRLVEQLKLADANQTV